MPTNIIQHHDFVDFNSLFENIKAQYVGLDFNDFSNFLHIPGEKHSFIATADGENRLKIALNIAVSSDEAREILNRASNVLISISYSSDTKCPLRVEEIAYLNAFVSSLPENCNATWGVSDDPSLGDSVNVILLVNIN